MPKPAKVERTVERLSLMLSIAAMRRYAWAPIPSDEDELVKELLQELETPHGAAVPIPPYVRLTLAAFSRRSASRAVRDRDSKHLRAAIVALKAAVEPGDDPRDLLGAVGVVYDAARRIGLDPAVTLSSIGIVPTPLDSAIRTIASIPSNEFKLADWGMAATTEEEGIRYTPRGQQPPPA